VIKKLGSAVVTTLLLFAAPAFATSDGCSLVKFNPAYINSTGFHYRPLTIDEKQHVVEFVKRTQGKPPAGIDEYPKMAAYLIYYVAVTTPNGAADSADSRIYFVDDNTQCVSFALPTISTP
jgi:hypothetical protein